jgi:hypothetical protein
MRVVLHSKAPCSTSLPFQCPVVPVCSGSFKASPASETSLVCGHSKRAWLVVVLTQRQL